MCQPATSSDPAPTSVSAVALAKPRLNRAIVLALVLVLLTGAGALWWMCARSEAIAFLPARVGAEWIVYPRQARADIREVKPRTALFRHSLVLANLPANATLTVCAFKGAAVAINGRVVNNILSTGRNWKSPSSGEVAGLLQAGTNEITAWVTNAIGPPALWLRLESGPLLLGTGEHWQVSASGTGWQRARRASQPLEFQPEAALDGSAGMLDLLNQAWPVEAAFGALSLALIWVTNWWLRHKRLQAGTLPTSTSTKLIYGLFAIVLIARAALFINNLPQLNRALGFDASDHEKYVGFIQKRHALPLANDGWQMFQPPLYYLASTLLLNVCGRSVADTDAVLFLRAINGVIGLLQCWLAFLCLRLLFRENPQAQAAGLLVAAFLPPTLYLSQYVTNEPLAALLVTLAIYLLLRALRAEKEGLRMPIGIGLALGGAMLAKFSALLALAFFPMALIQRGTALKQSVRRDWLLSVGAVVVGCLLVCGWHYGRVWARFGKPNVWNWDPQAGQNYWQDPGYRTTSYYTSFGRVLVSPSFSAFHSFADGIYSTLWGDGLASGVADRNYQPPWNYDLMAAGYWISLGVSLLLIIGAALLLARLLVKIQAEWWLVLGMVFLFGCGLVWMNLLLPSYAQAKAFYALPALLPFSAVVAVGWDWMRQRHRVVGIAVWVLLLVWSMTAYTSFWVRSVNSESPLLKGIDLGANLLDQGKLDEAIHQFQEAVRVNADSAEAHYCLGFALGKKGQTDEAIRQFQEALRLKPNYPEAHNNLGIALGRIGQTDEAIRQFQEATRLKLDYAEAHYDLGLALGMKGQTDEAIRQFQIAIRLKPDYSEARYNLGNALGIKGQVDPAISEYQEALRLKPGYAEAHYDLGLALGRKGQMDEAIRQLQEATRLKPDYAEAHYNLGLTLGMQGQTDEAIRQFQEAIRLKPDYAEAHNNLGIVLVRKGQMEKAIRRFQEALRLKPDYAAARKNLDVVRATKASSSPQPGASTNH
jgi:Flp pilus assembly protein TadD/4-amino-4-deoxy-L-arabinose transferase-like glycosyltransferase